MPGPSKGYKSFTKKTAGFRTILVCLSIATAILIVYAQIHDFEYFAIDDVKYLQNPQVSAGLNWKSIQWSFAAFHAGNWHPVTWLSHMVNVSLFGLNPGQHHLANLFWHLLNSIILFLIMARMTGALGPSAFVAGLFALHPVNVESVAWIAEHKNVLSTFFALVTIWAYSWYIERPSIRRYIPVFLGLAIGIMAKPMLVTLPCVFLLLDFWPLGRIKWGEWSTISGLVKEKLPLFGIVIISSMLTWMAQSQGGMIDPLERFPISLRLAAIPVFYLKYLGDLWWPSSLYFYRPHPGFPSPIALLGAVVLLIAVSVLAVRKAKTIPFLLTGWFWFLGTLVPVIGLVQLAAQGRQDRYMYLPAIGIFVIVAWSGAAVADYRRRLSFVLTITVLGISTLAALGVAAHRQVGYWQNSKTIYQHIIDENPGRSWALVAWGHALHQEGKHLEAFRKYQKALEIEPNNIKAHGQLARLGLEQGSAIKDPAKFRQKVALFRMAHHHLEKLVKLLPPQHADLMREKQEKIRELEYFFKEIRRPKK